MRNSSKGKMIHMIFRLKSKGLFLIILSGIFWGSMGIFVRHLSSYGFTPVQIACMRLVLAAIIFSVILLCKEPGGFKIHPKDIILFLALGLCSILFFTICYYTAIKMMTMSMAAILLYTSPIWVMLMSVVFFKETITKTKLLALSLSFAGCIFVSGMGNGNINFIGILIGLGAGVGYGLYSILGTIALKKYTPYSVTTFTFIVAALGSIVLCSPLNMINKIERAQSFVSLFIFVIITSLVTAVIPFMCYTIGLRSVEPSKAAIAATIEPMVATLIGAVIFHEKITLPSAIGILLILIAIIILNQKSQK